MSDEKNKETNNSSRDSCVRSIMISLCDGFRKFCVDPVAWFTLVLAISTVGLWSETKKTSTIVLAGQRAWLAPRDIEPLRSDWSSRQYIEISVPYENVGKEPALNVERIIRAGTLAKEDFRKSLIVDAKILDLLGGKACISAPSSNEDVIVFPGSKDTQLLPFPENNISKVRANTHFPLVVGCFVYKISDGSIHRTQFCSILEAVEDAPHWRSISCLTGNWAN